MTDTTIGPVGLFTLMLIVFATSVPIIIGYTVARSERSA